MLDSKDLNVSKIITLVDSDTFVGVLNYWIMVVAHRFKHLSVVTFRKTKIMVVTHVTLKIATRSSRYDFPAIFTQDPSVTSMSLKQKIYLPVISGLN